jgi:hypothetical protein
MMIRDEAADAQQLGHLRIFPMPALMPVIRETIRHLRLRALRHQQMGGHGSVVKRCVHAFISCALNRCCAEFSSAFL